MKNVSPPTSNSKTDRIERGVLLSTMGHVTQSGPGRWTVRSESNQARSYDVTARGCDCPDAKKNQAICKHAWASVGFVAAFVILALRKATSIELAGRILTPAYQMLSNLPAGYIRTLEDEYSRAVSRISAERKTSEAPTITKTPMLLLRECTHSTCKSTRCNQDVRIGGIAI